MKKKLEKKLLKPKFKLCKAEAVNGVTVSSKKSFFL